MVEGSVVPLLEANPRALAEASRDELVDIYRHYRSVSNEVIRRAVIERNRIDVLASVVLGYEVQPFHLSMLQFQFRHPQSLQLGYRGSGKTTICTIAKSIHLLLKDPNLRIMLCSKTTSNTQDFLKEIKDHFENNERLAEIFGPYYDPRRVAKWDETKIDVLPRTRVGKESSITCAGVDATITSRHVDVVFCDDLVVEENSRTKYMRQQVRTWYYKTLDPCLEPPDPSVPHRGERHILGTRYHYDDLYGYLIKKEMEEHHRVIPSLDAEGRSPWPEKHSPEWLKEKKKNMGTIFFNSQYQCDCEAMKGEFFDYDDCQVIDDDQIPKSLRIFQGNDLATSEKEKRKNAQYANVTIGIDPMTGNIYFLDFYLGHLGFPQQMDRAIEMHKKHDPIRSGAESNAYQKAFVQESKKRAKEDKQEYRFIPIYTDKDKVTRAMKLTPLWEAKRVFFRKNMEPLIDQFVLFPNHDYDDGLDATDIAIRASRKKRRGGRRREEPGLIGGGHG